MASEQVTALGKSRALELTFGHFKYLALGTGNNPDYTEASTGLVSETTASGYYRVELDNTFVSKKVTSEAVIYAENIDAETVITELGIVDSSTPGAGTFFSLAAIPDMTKTGDIQFKFTIVTTVD